MILHTWPELSPRRECEDEPHNVALDQSEQEMGYDHLAPGWDFSFECLRSPEGFPISTQIDNQNQLRSQPLHAATGWQVQMQRCRVHRGHGGRFRNQVRQRHTSASASKPKPAPASAWFSPVASSWNLGAGFLEFFKPLQESLYIVFLQVIRR